MKRILLTLLIFLGLANVVYADAIDDALSNANRAESDLQRDPFRKPEEVLRFFDIKEGMSVFDVFAGGGYYSELASYVVGPKGSVTMYNNKPWDDFVGQQVGTRLADDRLPNVVRYIDKPEDISAHEGQYDIAIFILGIHDIYYADPENGWVAIDKTKFLTGIYGLIKSGGILGIIDHIAKTGANPEVSGESLHRVDPAVIIKDLLAVGFTLEEQATFLNTAFDDLTTSAVSKQMRGSTSRAVMKFRK